MTSNDRNSHSILLVDDSATDREFMQRYLEKSRSNEYHFDECETGEEALNKIREQSFSCILLDYSLPDYDGLELYKQMLLIPAIQGTATIMLTGQGDEMTAVEAMKLGIKDYLVKGKITDVALRRTVKNALDKVQLETEIRQQQKELERTNRELSEKNAELDAFAATVSHDLRKPVYQIRDFISLINDKETPQDKREEFIDRIDTISNRMQNLITDILWFSRSNQVPLEKERLNLSALAREIFSRLLSVTTDSAVRFDCPDRIEVTADRRLIIIALENLLANSLKFTSKCASPHITMKAQQGSNSTTVSIEDNGCGITPEMLDKIFQPFVRGHSFAQYPGSGIGLATVQRIISRHGGTCWAEDTGEDGAKICFELPSRQ